MSLAGAIAEAVWSVLPTATVHLCQEDNGDRYPQTNVKFTVRVGRDSLSAAMGWIQAAELDDPSRLVNLAWELTKQLAKKAGITTDGEIPE